MRRAHHCSSKVKVADLNLSLGPTGREVASLQQQHQQQQPSNNNNNFVSEDNILYNMHTFPGGQAFPRGGWGLWEGG